MKKNLINYAVAIAISLGVLGCSKDGEVGPQGPKGDKGEQGITGKDGSTFLSGTTNPTASIGKEGDFFINLSARTLFGPKKGSDWGPAKVLSGEPGKDGAQGPAGENGNTILNGKGAPTAALGKVGDFYLDIETLDLYGAKTSKGWGSAVNLKAGSDNGVTVLLYSNQTVQNISIDERPTKQHQEEIKNLEDKITDSESRILTLEWLVVTRKEKYDEDIELLKNDASHSDEEKTSLREKLTLNLNKDIKKLNEEMNQNKNLIIYGEDQLSKIRGYEFHIIKSNYILPEKYQSSYQHGLTIVQFRISPPYMELWDDDVYYEQNDKYFDLYRSEKSKESEIILEGNASKFTKEEVKNIKFDIKVTLIAPTQVIEMKAKKVNLNDPKAVIKHLKN